MHGVGIHVAGCFPALMRIVLSVSVGQRYWWKDERRCQSESMAAVFLPVLFPFFFLESSLPFPSFLFVYPFFVVLFLTFACLSRPSMQTPRLVPGHLSLGTRNNSGPLEMDPPTSL